MDYVFILVGQGVLDLEMTRGEKPPHNASLIRLALFGRVADESRHNRLSVSLGYLGALEHVSLGEAMMGHIYQGWLSDGAPLREVFPCGLSLGISRFLDPYK